MNFTPSDFSKHPFLKWLPAALLLLAIFLFSARPSIDEASSLLRYIIFKGGHVTGYAMLSLSIWRGFEFRADRRWVSWLIAVFYAITDEYHQSFVPGRHPSAFDVLAFDNVGALLALWVTSQFTKQKQPAPAELVVGT